MKVPLDNDTWEKVSTALVSAGHRGADPAEALNKNYLILSPATRLEIQQIILGRLLETILAWQPHEMLRRLHLPQDGGTPADMFHAMTGFIQEFKDSLKEE